MSHIYKVLLREKERQEWIKIALPYYFNLDASGQPDNPEKFRTEVEKSLEIEWGRLKSARFGKSDIIRVAYVGYLI